jgi:large subunit ribosomal protein L22
MAKAKAVKPAKSGGKKATSTQDNVVATATLRHVRVSAQKARLVINMIKGKQLEPALQILKFSPKKTAGFAEKLLKSAMANAQEKGADLDKLWITGGWVDMGRTLKRFMPRAQGRATPIRKRSAHITLQLGER